MAEEDARRIGTEQDYQLRGNVTLPQLQETEQDFFELVANGSVAEVELYLNVHPDFKINVTNYQGITALHIAIEEKNAPMVKFLLSQPEIDPGDAHLYAIRENEIKIVGMILDKLNEISPGLEYASVTHSADFPDEATPLIIAAQYGHYELMQYLIEQRLHKIQRPHPPNCNCLNVCKRERELYDSLTVDRKRMFLYRAITNPAYICLTEEDPILASFNLSIELKMAASYDREFYNEYIQLSEELSEFAKDLIGCARKAHEVETVLKKTAGFSRSSRFVYPRLLLALDYKQKTFVAHPNVQEMIGNKWVDDWYEWRMRKTWIQCLTVLFRIILLPLIALIILLVPNTKIAKFLSSPVNKFLHSVASYFIFLIIVFLISNTDKDMQLRGPPDTGYEPILAIYVISYLWSIIRLCIMHGPRRFFRAPWNWYETCMIFLFVLTFICWIDAAIDVRINGQRDLERKYWHKYDPTLIGEGIYCLATIMAFFRLMFLCQLNYHLGPLQLSLGKMIHDVAKFIVIFAIVLLAFTSGLCKLYQYYDDMVQIDRSNIKVQQVSSFVDFPSSLKTLFWAVFCMTPIESADVIIENLPCDNDTETIINHHTFTEVIGYIAFASFEFISVVVVLNMLIACMTNTFTKVTDNVIVEWTFGRTEVYVDFMLMTTLPPPFNIIPTFDGFQTIVEYVKVLVKPPTNKRARWDFMQCCYIETIDDEKDETFAQVMMQLVQRYFRKKNREIERTNIEKLRRELMEVRGLLREALEAA
ncbi:PREDICTED: short transient receptor potential channel 5-like [Polistes canadensis]|uniref:short transient receptor potential channel 5-like n=1 Tax=Polistes canadensis TaxID=91411 RepID=UPI000718D840|nr:PREDICTED: short transient receptor potential channel 5-like [Polistes canadensis]